MNWRNILLLALIGGVGWTCSTRSARVGGESNWLKRCETNADCGLGSCVCNVCTNACSTGADCSALVGGVCFGADHPATALTCGATSMDQRICLPGCREDVDCLGGQRCEQGGCVLFGESIQEDAGPLMSGGGSGNADTTEADASVSSPDASTGMPVEPDGTGSGMDAGVVQDAEALGPICTVIEGSNGQARMFPTVSAAYADPTCLEIYLPAREEPYWVNRLNIERDLTIRGDTAVGQLRTSISPPQFPDGGPSTGNQISVVGGTLFTLRDLEVAQSNSLYISAGDLLAERVVFRSNPDGAVTLDSDGSHHVFRDVRFLGNTDESGAAIGQRGANVSLKLENCEFAGNVASVSDDTTFASGAALLLLGTGESDTQIIDCNFLTNETSAENALGVRGGLIRQDGGRLLLQDSRFYGNMVTSKNSPSGITGGLLLLNDVDVTMVRTEFDSNTVSNVGSGVIKGGMIGQQLTSDSTTSAIQQMLFVNNDMNGESGVDGAVIYLSCDGTNPSVHRHRLENSTFYRNAVTSYNDDILGGVLRAVTFGANACDLDLSIGNVTMTQQSLNFTGSGSAVGASVGFSDAGAGSLNVQLVGSVIDHGSLPDCSTSGLSVDNILTLMGDATGCNAGSAFLTGDANFGALPGGTGFDRVLMPVAPSAAIDVTSGTGCPTGLGATLGIDQRGYIRDDNCDLGAADVGAQTP